MWLKTQSGEYVNMDRANAITSAGSGSAWSLDVFLASGGSAIRLSGTWPTEAAADAAARRIVRGVDPSEY
jgi:hypothetical protein